MFLKRKHSCRLWQRNTKRNSTTRNQYTRCLQSQPRFIATIPRFKTLLKRLMISNLFLRHLNSCRMHLQLPYSVWKQPLTQDRQISLNMHLIVSQTETISLLLSRTLLLNLCCYNILHNPSKRLQIPSSIPCILCTAIPYTTKTCMCIVSRKKIWMRQKNWFVTWMKKKSFIKACMIVLSIQLPLTLDSLPRSWIRS